MNEALDLSTIRQKSGNLTFVAVLPELKMLNGRMQRMVRLLCTKCDKHIEIPLSRWQHQPASNCQPCALAANKKRKWGGIPKKQS